MRRPQAAAAAAQETAKQVDAKPAKVVCMSDMGTLTEDALLHVSCAHAAGERGAGTAKYLTKEEEQQVVVASQHGAANGHGHGSALGASAL